MSTVTLSQPHWAMTSAENPEGIASHPLTAALPAFHRSFSLFSAIPLPFGYRSAVALGQPSRAPPGATAALGGEGNPASPYLSSQTSSIRQLLKMLLSIKVNPLTSGCQQVPCLMKKMIGRTASSISLRSICHTSSLRVVGSLSADCRLISASTSGSQPV